MASLEVSIKAKITVWYKITVMLLKLLRLVSNKDAIKLKINGKYSSGLKVSDILKGVEIK